MPLTPRWSIAAALMLISTVIAYPANNSAGCPQYGCDPRTSFTSALCAPVQPSQSVLAPFNASGNVGGLGCITSSGVAVCTCPQGSTPNGTVMGFCGMALASNSPSGTLNLSVAYLYTGLGAGRCTAPIQTAQAGIFNSPIMNLVGDVIAWDAYHAAYVSADGTLQWTTAIAPAAPCPDATLPISITGRSTLVLVNNAIAEVATIFANGLPEAYITLEANSTRYIPIAQPSVAYNRMLLLTRAYGVMATGQLIPTAGLALAAVDQTYSPVQRLIWAWTLPLPVSASSCVPSPSGLQPGDETSLTVSNALVGDAGDTVMLAVACNGAAALMSVNVSTAAPEPVVLWSISVAMPVAALSPLQLVRGFDDDLMLLIIASPASVVAVNISDGSVAWQVQVAELQAPMMCGSGAVQLTGAAAMAAGNCSGHQGLPQLLLPALVKGTPQLLSLTLPTAPGSNATIEWCQRLPSPATGQVTLLSTMNGDNSSSPAVLLTTSTGMFAIA